MNLPLSKLFGLLLIGLAAAPALWARSEPVAFRLYSVDAADRLSAQAVADAPYRFSEPRHFINLGYDRRVHWIRFALGLKQASVLSQRFWFPQRFDLYRLHRNQAERVYSTGSLKPLRQRPVPTFPPKPGGPREYLIRAEGDQRRLLELRLWPWSELRRAQNLERSLLNALFGGMLLVVV